MEREVATTHGLALSLVRQGRGRPFVFQHGLGGDASQTADVFPLEIGWSCITLECRGHGRSDAGPPDAFSIATFATDLVSAIGARYRGPLHLGGISMGAAIALRIACLWPDLVSALVIARPAWLDDAAPRNMAPNAFVGELLRDYPIDEARKRFEESAMVAALEVEAPDNLVALRSMFNRLPAKTTSELLLRISSDGPGVDRAMLKSLRVPVLVIGNARDAVHPIEMARDLANSVPGARFIEITSKSESRERYRDEFRDTLSDFLRNLPSVLC